MRDDYINDNYDFKVDLSEWPPDRPTTFVNVALIHYKGSRTEQELKEISKPHKEGTPAVDNLVHRSKVTKDISKIFQTDLNDSPETKPPKFILIEGSPGIGKTLLAKKIAYLWAKKELLIYVRILFLLFLRDPKLQGVTTLEELIQYVSRKYLDEEKAKICLKQIMKLQVCIVMDGFDEYPKELRRDSFIADLIKGRVLHKCIVVLTSRPTTTIKMHGKVDRRVEILGFAQEERDKCISESLDSPDKRKQLQDYLIRQPVINGLVCNPLHLAILLHLFKIQKKLPETLNEVIESFVLHTIYRSLAKDELTPEPAGSVTVINDLPKDVLYIIKGLSKLAFIGLQNKRLAFSHNEIKAYCPEINNNIPGAFNGFGLLQVVEYLPKRGVGPNFSFNFLHFTIQEFLGALYVSDITVCPLEQQISLMETTFWDSTYSFMWMIYVGINGINSPAMLRFLYTAQPGADMTKLKVSDSITSDKTKCLHLFQCFMEAKATKEISNIFEIIINSEINFHELKILPHHISSLTLYISKYSIQLQSLNLRDCHIGDVGMNILKHFFTVNPHKALSIKYIDLFGNNSVLLWDVYCAIFGQNNLIKLNWSSLGGVSVEEIVTVMNNNTTVQSLNISNNDFSNDDAERIAEVLSNNTTLQELDFSNNDITTKGAIAISQCLVNNVKLQHLKISWNNHFIDTDHSTIDFLKKLKDVDVEVVANVVCKNEIVTKLDLSQHKISDSGAKSICKCIKSNKSIKEIDISRNRISSTGIKEILVALQINQTLQRFNISHNKISDDGAIALGECLKNNNTLQELNISYNEVSNVGIINIGKAFQMNTTLRLLDISHNKISDGGAIALSECLKCNNTLQELNVSYNEVSSDGIISIGEVLQINTTLQILNISYNKISDDGVIAFSECLKSRNNVKTLRMSLNNDSIYVVLDFMAQSCAMRKMRLGDTGGILISAYICKNYWIQKLDISHNNISDKGAVAISECLKANKTLKELCMSNNNISDHGVIKIAEAIQINITLKLLDISHNNISTKCKKVVTALSNGLKYNNALEVLGISWKDNNTTCTYVYAVNEINKKCYVSNTRAQLTTNPIHYVNDEEWFDRSQFTHRHFSDTIKRLRFHDTEAILLTAFAYGNADVTKLEIMRSEVSDIAAIVISDFLKTNEALQKLKVSENAISVQAIKHIMNAIQTNTTLEVLDISRNNLSDDAAISIGECLSNNNKLQNFNMSYNKLSNIGISSIGNALQMNTALQILDISHNNISDDGAVAIGEYLKKNYTLQCLNMSHNQLSSNGIISIGKAVQVNTTLQILYILHNNLSDNDLLTFSDYLKENSTLHQLRISWNNNFYLNSKDKVFSSCCKTLGNTGAILTSAFFHHNIYTNIQILNISNQDISDDGVVAISEYLKISNTIQELDISRNAISNIGIVYISEALHVNTTLQVFNISHNNISNDGVVVISECLRSNNTLEQLNMSHNQISDIGAINIGEVLQINTTLQKLDTSHNNITDVGALAIGEALRSYDEDNSLNKEVVNIQTSALHNLDMSGNDISSEGIITLSKFLRNNNKLLMLNISWKDGRFPIVLDRTIKFCNMPSKFLGNTGTILTLAFFHTIKKLDISYNNISKDGALAISDYLKTEKVLKELNISNNKLSNHGIIKIAEAIQINTTLKLLNISHNGISRCKKVETALSDSLRHNNALQVLGISWNDIDTTYVYTVGINKKCLVGTTWPRSEWKKSAVHYINENDHEIFDHHYTLYKLKKLQFDSTEAILLTALVRNCVSVKTIKILGSKISHSAATIISNFLKTNRTLQILEFSHNTISSKAINQFMKAIQVNKSLQSVNVLHNSISDDGVVTISNCFKNNYRLQKFDFSCNKIEIINNDKLQTLDVSHSDFVAIGEYLKHDNALQNLIISHNKINILNIAQALKFNMKLQMLDISHDGISDDGAVAISECLKYNCTLQELDISYNEISNVGIINIGKALQTNTALQILDLSYNKLSDDGVVTFCKYLKQNDTLHQLKVSYNNNNFYLNSKGTREHFNQLGNVGAVLISAFFCNNANTNIHELDISSCKITYDGTVAICEYLKNNDSLQKLDISYSEISNSGIINIVEALETDTTLQILDISHNDISDDGALAIGKYLKSINTLRQLNMSHNEVSDIGIIGIGKALETNTTLQLLVVSYNKISDHGVVAIGECLKHNNALQQLKMSDNQISNNGIINIGNALQTNTTLQMLDVSHDRHTIFDDAILRRYYTTNAGVTNEDNIQNSTMQKLDRSSNSISNEGIDALSKCLKNNNALNKLLISWKDCDFTFDGTRDFCDMTHRRFGIIGTILLSALLFHNDIIKKLDVSYNNIFDAGAVAIGEYLRVNKTCKELNMSNNDITIYGMIAIAEGIKMNTTLSLLNVSHNNMSRSTDAMATLSDHLKHNNTLQVLGISWNDTHTTYIYTVGINNGCYIDSKWPKSKWANGTVQYERNDSVKEYVVYSNQTTHKLPFNDTEAILLIAIAHGNADVKIIEIVNCEISANAAIVISDFLKRNETFKNLKLSQSTVSIEAIEHIMKAIQTNTNTSLEMLDISSNNLCDDGVIVISKYLKHNRTIKELNIAGNIITEQGAKIFADLFCCNCKIETVANSGSLSKITKVYSALQKIDISHNFISDYGAAAIGECLKLNKVLKELNLSDNKINNYGVAKIADAIKINTTLLKLNISHNIISTDGVVAINEYLKFNKTLLELDLSWNKITSSGAVNIAEAFEINGTLKKLDLSHNNISKSIVTSFSRYFKYNGGLQELIISWNNTDDTTYIYTSTTKCYVNIIWPYSALRSSNKYSLEICHKLKFGNTEATLLTSLVDKNVKKLEIIKSEVSDDAAIVLSDFLKANNILHEFQLSMSKISSEAIKLIIKAIQTNTTLQTLDISSIDISADVAVVIGECLKYNKTLEVLDISNNFIFQEIIAIANSIQENTTLLKLFLYKNMIRDDGVVAVCECLTKNKTLQEISLSWDSWDSTVGEDLEVTKIAAAIAVNTSLCTLDLSSQHVNDSVYFTMTLLTAMEHNHTITKLVLPIGLNNEATVKLHKINEERIKKGNKTLLTEYKYK